MVSSLDRSGWNESSHYLGEGDDVRLYGAVRCSEPCYLEYESVVGGRRSYIFQPMFLRSGFLRYVENCI